MSEKTVIVLLNWNSREMTGECIRSLLAMEAKDFEILVVDNGSRDGSVEYLRSRFPQIRVVANDRNLGFAAGCNIGMRYALAEGVEFVLLVNNDTIADVRILAALLEEAKCHPEAGMISPKIYFYDLPDRLWWAGGTFSLWVGIPKHVARKKKDVGQFDTPRAIGWATGCAVLIRAQALRRVGLFDETFFGNGEDLDLSLRMRKAGYQIRYAPGAKLWHKEGVDYRKNVGEHVRKFTGTRNLLWVMHKHARLVQWVTFWPNFLLRYVLFFIVLSLWRGDFRSARAVLRAIFAFAAMRNRSDVFASSPEPVESLGSLTNLSSQKKILDANQH